MTLHEGLYDALARKTPDRPFIAVVIASLCAVTIGAVTAPTVKFSDSRLKNGLRVIIAEDHAAPVFSVAVAYNVGSRDERIGAPASPICSNT